MDVGWLSAGVLLVLLGLFMWWSGAAPRQILLVLVLAAAGIAATDLAWDAVIEAGNR